MNNTCVLYLHIQSTSRNFHICFQCLLSYTVTFSMNTHSGRNGGPSSSPIWFSAPGTPKVRVYQKGNRLRKRELDRQMSRGWNFLPTWSSVISHPDRRQTDPEACMCQRTGEITCFPGLLFSWAVCSDSRPIIGTVEQPVSSSTTVDPPWIVSRNPCPICPPPNHCVRVQWAK